MMLFILITLLYTELTKNTKNAIILLVKGDIMNNKEYPLYMVKIVIRAVKTLEHMQNFVLENRISQNSFIEYFNLLKTLYNKHFISDDDFLSYANSLLNAKVIIKNEEIYNQTIQELNEFVSNIKCNLER